MGKKQLKTVGSKPPWDEELRRWLEKYISQHPHHTTDVLSRSYYIGEPRAVLDDYVAGILFLPAESGGRGADPNNSSVETSVRAFRESVEGTIRHGYANTFVETRTWFQLQQACSTAIEENVIVIVYGKPGVGKSRCLMEFATRHVTTAPILMLCSRNITTHYFARRLARALKLDETRNTAYIEDLAAEKLKRYPRPLFIDQANYLDEKALGLVCHLWEVGRIPVVLAGTKDLYDLFITSRFTEGVRAQLSSRVALHYLLAELSLPEAKAIIKRALGNLASDEVVAKIYNVTGGIHRHVDMIMPRILELVERNTTKLDAGEITIIDIIIIAGSRLITG